MREGLPPILAYFVQTQAAVSVLYGIKKDAPTISVRSLIDMICWGKLKPRSALRAGLSRLQNIIGSKWGEGVPHPPSPIPPTATPHPT